MSKIRTTYKVLRSLVFAAILAIVGIYVLLYVALSLPFVENAIKNKTQSAISDFIGSEVTMTDLDIHPFNEVRIHGLRVKDKNGKVCLYAQTIGAGINIWKLIFKGKIELTYGEITGLNASIYQAKEGEPLNIMFIIDAFKPKDKNKPPTPFDLKLHNIVIRKSALKFDRLYVADSNSGIFDANHIEISDLKADITVPKLKNNDFIIDCRRFSFKEKSGLDVVNISFKTHITDKSISVNDLLIKLPGTELRPADMQLSFSSFSKIKEAFSNGNHQFIIVDNEVDPHDFSCFCPLLGEIGFPLTLNVDISGNLNHIKVDRLQLSNVSRGLDLNAAASVNNIIKKGCRDVSISDLEVSLDYEALPESCRRLFQSLNVKTSDLAGRIGWAKLLAAGRYSEADKKMNADISLESGCGNLTVYLESAVVPGAKIPFKGISAEIAADAIDIGRIIADSRFGRTSINLTADISSPDKTGSGSVYAEILDFEYLNRQYNSITLNLEKQKEIYDVALKANDEDFNFTVDAFFKPNGKDSRINITADIITANLQALQLPGEMMQYNVSGGLFVEAQGNTPDNLTGEINISNLRLQGAKKSLNLNHANLYCENISESDKKIIFESDWGEVAVEGHFSYYDIASVLQNELALELPALIKPARRHVVSPVYADFLIKLYPTKVPYDFFGINMYPGTDVLISGLLDSDNSNYTLNADAPFITMSNGKIIKSTNLNVSSSNHKLHTDASTIWPVKNGMAPLQLKADIINDRASLDFSWDLQADKKIKGSICLDAELCKNQLTSKPDISINIKPSTFYLRDDKWNVEPAVIDFNGNNLEVNHLKIWHDSQYLDINGKVSENPEDKLTVGLASINLDYIFNFLNINYVTFGGMATGKITASELFTKSPKAATDYLHVENLSYNDAVLGDGDLTSKWLNDEKKVAIYADIREKGRRRATIDGGIWVTRDSLSFALDADSVNIKFIQPFMQAFSSDVEGRASGKATLYGTFKDIDLIGRLHADRIRMKLDYTNVYYSGSDSVIMTPGHIDIPHFRLYDGEGHSALLSGWLTHDYFHNPRFMFNLSDANSFLCYNTNKKINPDWYGKIYGNGKATLNGRPGLVTLDVDMSTTQGSTFTFELNDTQVAEDYTFLSFSDKKKESMQIEDDIQFAEGKQSGVTAKQNVDSGTIFSMIIRGTVTTGTEAVLVMDPAAGDRIRARGDGAFQISYDTESDEMKIYGKYSLERGSYNFSLQDLILKDFTIRSGSSISFNGDPMKADLDITAIYRVNTNLSDLDKSFSSDRELNRTNVPVDAVLKVKGDMESPDIFFDIEMPTLTQDVIRKVKSIISTDDMMNRQIIYLLALNRFYTPEYMGGNSSGGAELASVASSTISSQLANIMGQLTNKVSLAPSIRSDKGDFSDMEVDLALSSHLLNNRLLINGNFGYRDRTTSQTTFVGDFDIEYLLSKSGALRLKAYNHFNDQNYYLRSALTTQGVGIVYRRDFDNPFTFLKRRKKKNDNDSVATEKDKTMKRDSVGIEK